MDGFTILDDWNPSEETLRKWAYDEKLALTDQDEDLALQDERYLSVLLELADDPGCPKASYILSCLDHFLMCVILNRSGGDHLFIVRKGVELAAQAKSDSIRDWRELQQRRLSYREGIGAVDREMAFSMAHDLLIGTCRRADLWLVGESDRIWEIQLSEPYGSPCRERISIEKQTGHFSYDRSYLGP